MCLCEVLFFVLHVQRFFFFLKVLRFSEVHQKKYKGRIVS